jgi:hypothetical protein
MSSKVLIGIMCLAKAMYTRTNRQARHCHACIHGNACTTPTRSKLLLLGSLKPLTFSHMSTGLPQNTIVCRSLQIVFASHSVFVFLSVMWTHMCYLPDTIRQASKYQKLGHRRQTYLCKRVHYTCNPEDVKGGVFKCAGSST